jgi:hypothetical protein
MKQRVKIKEAIIKNNELQLITDVELDLTTLSASGQMLVDSDQLAFIYIAELNGEYVYVTIPNGVWPTLRSGLESEYEAYLANNQSRLHLSGYREELNYLIENIKGNSNYGDEMVGKVESIF